jgi:hypothetical protein
MVSQCHSVVSKISGSGLKRTIVPLPCAFLSAGLVCIGAVGTPRT